MADFARALVEYNLNSYRSECCTFPVKSTRLLSVSSNKPQMPKKNSFLAILTTEFYTYFTKPMVSFEDQIIYRLLGLQYHCDLESPDPTED